MADLRDKLLRTSDLPRYLQSLTVLLRRPIASSDLLTVQDTEAILEKFKKTPRSPISRFELPFEARGETRFSVFLARLATANASDVYVWLPPSVSCGLMGPVPLSAIDINFPFDLNSEGIFEVFTIDLSDRLLLDYSIEEDKQILEVEASGEHWGRVSY